MLAKIEQIEMLSAPIVAGLLPAWAESLATQEHEKRYCEHFTYKNVHLSEITAAKRERIFASAAKLLDVAVAYVMEEMNESALRAAEVTFHRAVAGRSVITPRNPAEYCAEMDADVLDWVLDTQQSMTTIHERANVELIRLRQQIR